MIKFNTKPLNNKLTKEHNKNLKKLDKIKDIIHEEFKIFFKDKTIKKIVRIQQQPNSYFVITSDDVVSKVEITPILSDTYQFKLDVNFQRTLKSPS